MIKKLLLTLFTVSLISCTDQGASFFQKEVEGSVTNFEDDLHGTYASTYKPLKSENIVIRNATVFDGNGNKFQNFDVHFSDGEIQAVEAIAGGGRLSCRFCHAQGWTPVAAPGDQG